MMRYLKCPGRSFQLVESLLVLMQAVTSSHVPRNVKPQLAALVVIKGSKCSFRGKDSFKSLTIPKPKMKGSDVYMSKSIFELGHTVQMSQRS